MIFALRRNLIAYREAVKRGRWQESEQFCFFDFPIRDLHGSTLGIIGEGTLGQRVAEIGKALGMRTLFAAHKAEPARPPIPPGGGAGDERCHHPAFAAAPGDPRHDRHAGVPRHEAAAVADQHRSRWIGERN